MYTAKRPGAKPRVVVSKVSRVYGVMTSSHSFDDGPDWDALARYRAGESAPDEATAVAAWLAQHPLDEAMIEALDAAVGAHFGTDDMSAVPVNVESALGRLHQRMNESAPATPRLTVSRGGASAEMPPQRTRSWALGGLAAAAAIGAIAVALNRSAPSTDVATVSPVSPAATAREYRTAVGVVDSVVLSDGTRVLLAPSSHLTVPATYATGTREVTLEGVARFSVRHDAAAPFAVHAGKTIVRDIGTRFTVRAPGGATAQVTVAVSEGQVTLASSASNATPTALNAGDRGEVNADGAVIASRGVVHGDVDAWARGTLVYTAAPLTLVRDDLKRWYGLDLQADDSVLASRRLTATFEKQDADQLLHTLGLALGMSVQRSGTIVTLRPVAIGR
jgi:transmembrane sensor